MNLNVYTDGEITTQKKNIKMTLKHGIFVKYILRIKIIKS